MMLMKLGRRRVDVEIRWGDVGSKLGLIIILIIKFIHWLMARGWPRRQMSRLKIGIEFNEVEEGAPPNFHVHSMCLALSR